MKHKEFEFLVDALKTLPSISQKSANKIAYFLLEKDEKYINDLIQRILDFKKSTKSCMLCNNLAFNSIYCDICSNNDRDNTKLCIVSHIEDVEKIEKAETFFGTYYVLNYELSLKDKNHNKKIDLLKLENLINKKQVKEILLATNMTVNGELTSSYIVKYLEQKNFDVQIYRLAMGIPFNASLDYIDWESLKYSIENKKKIK